jgi:hypothetical protein
VGTKKPSPPLCLQPRFGVGSQFFWERVSNGLEAGKFFQGVGGAMWTIGKGEFFGEGMPFGGVEVMLVLVICGLFSF